jgi:hypothetical protein
MLGLLESRKPKPLKEAAWTGEIANKDKTEKLVKVKSCAIAENCFMILFKIVYWVSSILRAKN